VVKFSSLVLSLWFLRYRYRVAFLLLRVSFLAAGVGFSSYYRLLRVLRGQQSHNTEVAEMLCALCVKVWEAQRSRRTSFWLRPTAALGLPVNQNARPDFHGPGSNTSL
jgi:hypothetical protein